MNAHEFADAVADRVFTGYASSGPGLRDKIKTVVLGTLATYEPEARDLERKLAITRAAHKGSIALLQVEIARAKLHTAKAQQVAADNAVCYRDLRLSISEWESRTGCDHDRLLEDELFDD